MKALKIFEKFTLDSDPIHDMGIGNITFQNIKRGDVIVRTKGHVKFNYIHIGDVCLVTKVKRGTNTLILWLITFSRITNIVKYYRQQLFSENPELKYDGNFYAEPVRSWEKNFRILQPRELRQFESLNEKFSEDSDPIHDLGIGLPAVYQNLKKGDILRIKKYINPGFPKPGSYLLITKKPEKYPGREFDLRLTVEYFLNMSYLKKSKNYGSTNSWGFSFAFFKEYFKYIGNIKDLKESVNEKFEQGTDPISDMGIGFYVKRNFNDEEEIVEWLIKNLHYILETNKIPNDIIYKKANLLFKWEYWNKIDEYVSKYITWDNYKITLNMIDIPLYEKLKKLGYPKKSRIVKQ